MPNLGPWVPERCPGTQVGRLSTSESALGHWAKPDAVLTLRACETQRGEHYEQAENQDDGGDRIDLRGDAKTDQRIDPNRKVIEEGPELKNAMTNSSTDSVKATRAPAITPGKMAGSVTRRKVSTGPA